MDMLTLPLLQQEAQGAFTAVAHSFASGRIVGLDAASHQPLLLAVSEDKSLHLWDWLRKTCVVAAQLLEEPLCCALHPGGTMALVGSAEQLRMYYLLRVRCTGPKEDVREGEQGWIRCRKPGWLLVGGMLHNVMWQSGYAEISLRIAHQKLYGRVFLATDAL
jgi:hypothetical protein